MDFNGNGRTDILSGSWPGDLYLFRREADGNFAAPEKLKDRDGELIKVGSASAVFAADWNANGLLDLLVGNISGEVYLILNEGTAEEPEFGTPVQLEADGQPIKGPRGDAGPVVADWDGDGKLDLLVGNGDGSVSWYRNVGTAEEPVLAAGEFLVSAGQASRPESSEDGGPRRGTRAKICVADWNGNGRLDLLLGDFSIESIQQRELTEEEQAAKEEAEKRWNEFLAKYARIARPADDESPEAAREREKQINELQPESRALRQELMKYQTVRQLRREYHGWVWVFLRNDTARVAEADDS